MDPEGKADNSFGFLQWISAVTHRFNIELNDLLVEQTLCAGDDFSIEERVTNVFRGEL